MGNIKREGSFQYKNRQRYKQIGFFFANDFAFKLWYYWKQDYRMVSPHQNQLL